MSLRDSNPFVDADLDLIITTFEKTMVKSRNTDSIFVPFRRDLISMKSYPESIIGAIDGVPKSNLEESVNPGLPVIKDANAEVGSSSAEENEDQTEADWTEKVKNWVSECVPCTGDLERTLSAMNADFFKDIGEGWDKTLDKTLNQLKELDFLLDDVDVTPVLCEIGDIFKSQCSPDLKKLQFLLLSQLQQMEKEISLDLGTFESYLTSILSPVFNQMASNLDIIDDLALTPIKCILNNISYQIERAPTLMREAVSVYREQEKDVRSTIQSFSPPPNEAADVAANARRAEQERQAQDRRNVQSVKKATKTTSDAVKNIKSQFDVLKKLQEYLKAGLKTLEEKKKWLLNVIEELTDVSSDRWDKNLNFGKNKTDLLSYISLLKAMIEADAKDLFSCGSDSGNMNQEDAATIANNWEHPSESLEIIAENGNIITRRKDSNVSERTPGVEGLLTGSQGPDGLRVRPSNIVIKRPISSCLKKVTLEEADQVDHWIQQLES